jgi:hypothetical protein
MILARINVDMGVYDDTRYLLQIKKWWGWKTIYSSYNLLYCKDKLKELESVLEIEFIRATKL